MIVRQRGERIQIGVLEDGVLAEHYVSHTTADSLIGNVYLGKVQNVLPSDGGRLRRHRPRPQRRALCRRGRLGRLQHGNAPRKIENALKSGDPVLVQVTKDPMGHKGPGSAQPGRTPRPVPGLCARRLHGRPPLTQAARY